MKKRRQRIISVFLCMSLFIGMGERLEYKKAEAEQIHTLSNPQVVSESSLPSGQKVTWDCLWFGSYPQTEVVSEENSEQIAILDDRHYGYETITTSQWSAITEATYDNRGDAVVNGVKYRRIKRSDATYFSDESTTNYSWSDAATYHYFKYEPIKWRVLSVNGQDAFLMADLSLDDQRYNDSYVSVDWENCTLRSWLNGYGGSSNVCKKDYRNDNFMDTAFNSSQKEILKKIVVTNDKNSCYGTEGGNDTADTIFLLSEKEVCDTSYGFISEGTEWDDARRSKCSTYATAMGCHTNSNQSVSPAFAGCWSTWFLRSPGESSLNAVDVSVAGIVGLAGAYVASNLHAVRPALHINLESVDAGVCSYAGKVSSDGTKEETPKPSEETGTEVLSPLDAELIEKVKLYTSDGGKQYLSAFQSMAKILDNEQVSQADKLALLNDFYTRFGISNLQEGISYTRDAMYAKQAYDYLRNDELYLNYQYAYWLNNTGKGKLARGLLLTDGWIFNGDLVQYINPSTYITQETNSIKNYKTMLLDFMQNDSPEYEALAYSANLKKLLSGITDTINGTSVELLEKKIDNCSSIEEMNQLMFSTDFGWDSEKQTYEVQGYTQLSKALKYSGITLNIASEALEDITNIVLIETKMESINHYCEFLELVSEGEEYLPYGLVVAAQQLLEESMHPFMTQLTNIVGQLSDHITDDVFDLSGYLEESVGNVLASKITIWDLSKETFGSAIATIKLAAFCTDKITGIGKVVKQSAYIEAYACLGIYFSELLAESKNTFLANKSVDNAWEFYNRYQLLFQIRYMGENAYLTMCKTSAVTILLAKCDFDYFDITDRENYVKEEFEHLNNYCIFHLKNASAMPDDKIYKQKAVISCPVNVEICDEGGKVIYTLYDGKVCDEETEKGRFICTYNSITGDYSKIIYLNDSADYKIRIVGTDSGEVSMSLASSQAEGVKTAQMAGVPVQKNAVITLQTDDNQYTVDFDGDGNVESSDVLVDMEPGKFVAVESMELSADKLQLKVGDTIALGARVSPGNATFPNVIWSSDSEDVATVSNGKVTAIGEGTAMIYAKTSGGNVVAFCPVTVKSDVQEKKDISDSIIKLVQTTCIYDGQEKKPKVEIDGLEEGKDYIVSYENNIDVGTATAIVTGIGDYTGMASRIFTIKAPDAGTDTGIGTEDNSGISIDIGNSKKTISIQECSVKLSKNKLTDTGSPKKPKVTVMYSGSQLAEGTDYEISYQKNRKVGTAFAEIVGKNNFSGNRKIKFKIIPANTKIIQITVHSKSFTVKWKKRRSQITGYQIQYGKNQNMKNAHRKKICTKVKTSVTLTGVKPKKSYYVRIRTYKKLNGKKYYSNWSKVKKTGR